MPRVRNLIQNGTVVEQPIYNNVELTKWIHNGVVVWEKGAYPVEYIETEKFSIFSYNSYGFHGSDRRYIGDIFNQSIYSEGDSFEINGLTCTMESGNVFVINGRATAQTRIPYAMGSMVLPPAEAAGGDTDILCYGLPIDVPEGITIEFVAQGSTGIDDGYGCMVDLGGSSGNISVSSTIVIEEGTALYNVKMTPVMRFLNQGRIYWVTIVLPFSTHQYKCEYIRYKEVVDYFDGKIFNLPVHLQWTTTSYGDIGPLSRGVVSRGSRDSYNVKGALFSYKSLNDVIEDWEFYKGTTSLSPYVKGAYIVSSPTKDLLKPTIGVVDCDDFHILSGGINGLSDFLSQHQYATPIESASAPLFLEILGSVTDWKTGYNIYNISFDIEMSGTFPSYTETPFFRGDNFLCLVVYRQPNYYKLIEVTLDGVETEIYDFKGYYDGIFGVDIDQSGVYSFMYGLKDGETDLIAVDLKNNVYISEKIPDDFGSWVIGNFNFGSSSVEEKAIITRVKLPLR